MKPICLYTILHPLVDACSVTVLVVGGISWQRVLAYNALAFALQLPLGEVGAGDVVARQKGETRIVILEI